MIHILKVELKFENHSKMNGLVMMEKKKTNVKMYLKGTVHLKLKMINNHSCNYNLFLNFESVISLEVNDQNPLFNFGILIKKGNSCCTSFPQV